ncbi:MAG: hypothetical protein PHD04_02435 [Candidatus Pacebacteria bacterium]|nr:hypothetical protein [Candidatus Paceibacterota bacterium]
MQSNNTILIIIATLVVGAGAYWFFFTGTGNDVPLVPTDMTQNSAQLRFNKLVSELGSISFDTRIFSDPRFDMLLDLATPIAPETSGRFDPFASIPGVIGK